MASGIGQILREARNRRKVDLSTVETATRIRARFLRAIENEEWDVLPEGVYTRGFIRTYATYLGLDGERLAEDFRRDVEGADRHGPSVELAPVAASAATGTPGGRRSLPRPAWLVAVAAIGVAVLVVVLLPGGGNGGGSGNGTTAHRRGAKTKPQNTSHPGAPVRAAHPEGVSMRLSANAEVWVCVLDAKGRRLVDGQILEAGAEEGPFRSGSFTVAFGNGEVAMTIDGKRAEIPETSSPVGYSIDGSGALTELSEEERPSCT
jgi:cytoskeleton protein RodZ